MKKLNVELVHPTQDYRTVGDLQEDAKLILMDVDSDIQALKDDYGEEFVEELSGFGCFFVEEKEGEFARLYGCSSSVPWLNQSVTRLKTSSEIVAEYISKRDS